MNRLEAVLVNLFCTLREDLRDASSIGLALKAEGGSITLRIRTQRASGDAKQPHFAIVVGVGERDGAFRISYKPSGAPLAEPLVAVVSADAAGSLLDRIGRFLEQERRRLDSYRQGA
jgi:hypothetical protein